MNAQQIKKHFKR